jgi:plasmid stabilization system protein ParE
VTRPERLAVHPDALRESAEAERWYAERDLRAARELAREIDAAVAEVARVPERWRCHADGHRRCPLRRYPFAIVYDLRAGAIDVLAFAHASRRPGYWSRRTSS